MRAEALDITIESRGPAVWLRLSGPFHNEQAPNIREKILSLLLDGNRNIIIHMEQVTFVDTGVPAMLLELLNTVRGKEGEVHFVFRNEAVTRAFAPFRNLMSIYPDEQALLSGGFIAGIRRTTQVLFRRTGVRLSRPVAVFLLVILCGWFLTLVFTIHLQGRRIREQAAEIDQLTQWQKKAVLEIDQLTARLKPLEQLGLLPDSSSVRTP
jgi:anti-anti-sigma factor